MNNNDNNNDNNILIEFDLSKKKKKTKTKSVNKSNSNLYTYNTMLDVFYEKLKLNNPELFSKKNKVVIPKLRSIFANKKTFWINFTEFCNVINRTTDLVQSFINNDFQCTSSITNNGQLKLSGRFSSQQLEKCMRQFISSHVSCKSCKSLDTNIEKNKINRLNFIVCNHCRASSSI